MALLFMDSFDHYATAQILDKWPSVTASFGTTAIVTTPTRTGVGALSVGGVDTIRYRNVPTVASGTAFITGFAFQKTANPSAPYYLSIPIEAGVVFQTGVALTNAGRVCVYRGTTATILDTGATILANNTWYYLEFRSVVHASAGSYEVRINGATELSATGVNTLGGGTGIINLYGVGAYGVAQNYIDDLYLCDGTGAAPWNTFLGDCRVDACYPTAEGAVAAWTPSTGTDNALVLDESAPNGDTDYTSAATAGLTDTFVVQDAPVGTVIYGVQQCLSMRKTDVGTCTVAPVVRHSGTNYVGASLSPGTTYGYGLQVAQTNPGTSAQWTEAEFNNAEFGYTRVT